MLRPALFSLLLALTASADAGTILADSTMTPAGSPYAVTSAITVAPGVTLTIEPGVELVFSAGRELVVEGALVARGTEVDPIRFTSTSAAPGYWRGIRFADSADDASYDGSGEYLSGSILEWCRLEYGGNDQLQRAAIHLEDASPALLDIDLERPGWRGVFADYTGTLGLRILRGRVHRAVGTGITLFRGAGHRITGVVVSGVTGDLGADAKGIDLYLADGCVLENNVADDCGTGIDALACDDLVLLDNHTEDNGDRGLEVSGDRMEVTGHTSLRDATNLVGSIDGLVADCTISQAAGEAIFAGGDGIEVRDTQVTSCGSGVRVFNADQAMITGNRITDCGPGGAGLTVESSSSVTVSGNTVTGNTGHPVGGFHLMPSGGAATVSGNDFSYNAFHEIGSILAPTNLVLIEAAADLSGHPNGQTFNTLRDSAATGYSLRYDGTAPLPAERVCWGTTDLPAIEARILEEGAGMVTVDPPTDCPAALAIPDDGGRAALPVLLAPNPMRTHARIAFSLARAGRVDAEVYDVRGRRVAVLQAGRRAAGPVVLGWDGRAAGGRAAAAGVYLVRVRTAEGIAVKRVVKLGR